MRVKEIKFQMSNKVAKLFAILLLFGLVNYYSINIVSDNNTNSLRLSVNSLEYEFNGLFNDRHSVFKIWSNITVENTSPEEITLLFSGGQWDTQVVCILANKNLEVVVSEGITLPAIWPITFPPGLTNTVDYVELHIYGYNLTRLPEGSYRLTIGEDLSEFYEEIKGPAKIYFSVNNKHELFFSENLYSLSFPITYLLIPVCTLLILVYRRFKIKKKVII